MNRISRYFSVRIDFLRESLTREGLRYAFSIDKDIFFTVNKFIRNFVIVCYSGFFLYYLTILSNLFWAPYSAGVRIVLPLTLFGSQVCYFLVLVLIVLDLWFMFRSALHLVFIAENGIKPLGFYGE